jgi:hypothetical protein
MVWTGISAQTRIVAGVELDFADVIPPSPTSETNRRVLLDDVPQGRANVPHHLSNAGIGFPPIQIVI